jgi:hypothetical protein
LATGNAQQVGIFDPKTNQVVGAGGAGGEIFKNEVSEECKNKELRERMWDLSMKAVGLA